MATTADEFDPPKIIFDAIVRDSLSPVLAGTASEMDTPFVAKLSVWVGQHEIFKSFFAEPGYLSATTSEENVDVRIQCRRLWLIVAWHKRCTKKIRRPCARDLQILKGAKNIN